MLKATKRTIIDGVAYCLLNNLTFSIFQVWIVSSWPTLPTARAVLMIILPEHWVCPLMTSSAICVYIKKWKKKFNKNVRCLFTLKNCLANRT